MPELSLEAEGKTNRGLIKAKAADAAVDGHVITPDFGREQLDKSRTDFLDMARITGKDNARQHIEAKLGMIEAAKTAFNKEKVTE